MNVRALRASLLVASMLAVAGARGDDALAIGGVRLTLGTTRDGARAELKKNANLLVTRLGDSELAVADTKAMQAVAVLTFDRKGTLRRILKNWTPQPDSVVAFALALHELATDLTGGSSAGGRPCALSAPRRSPVGPNAWLRDPGKPDLEIREILLTCGDRAILIHVRRPSEATKVSDVLRIEKVLLYEAMGDAPGRPGEGADTALSPGK